MADKSSVRLNKEQAINAALLFLRREFGNNDISATSLRCTVDCLRDEEHDTVTYEFVYNARTLVVVRNGTYKPAVSWKSKEG